VNCHLTAKACSHCQKKAAQFQVNFECCHQCRSDCLGCELLIQKEGSGRSLPGQTVVAKG
jgi:hypothetical protein